MHGDDLFIRPPAEDDDEDSIYVWLITFADLFTLLLGFFVLLFSMSQVDAKRFTDSFSSVQQALGVKGGPKTVRATAEQGGIMDAVALQRQLVEAQRKAFVDVRTFLNKKGVEGVIGGIFDQGIITLDVAAGALFEKDKVELTPGGEKTLLVLKDLFIQHNDQRINIKGYTDDQPPAPGGRFKDNWEISAMRAVNVLRFFLKNGIEESRFTATGLADMDPRYPNTSDENRSKNRRVEFSLEKRITK